MSDAEARRHRPPGCASCRARPWCAAGTETADPMRALGAGLRFADAGTDVLRQGASSDHMVVAVDGWICLYEILEDGRRQVLDFALPGDAVALGPDRQVLPFGAQALTDAWLCFIPRGRFLEAARNRPELMLRLARMMARQTSRAYDHLTSLGRRTALERLAHLLNELFLRAANGSDGQAVRLPLTQSQIGDALGLTAVHTNRMLKVLRQRGIVALDNHTLRILAPERLARLAGIDAEAPATPYHGTGGHHGHPCPAYP